MGNIPGVSMDLPESGILSWLNISRLGTDGEVVQRLKEDARILVNPGSQYGFQGKGHIRIVTVCFREDEQAEECFGRIRRTLLKMAEERNL